jgi:hypothetical protein
MKEFEIDVQELLNANQQCVCIVGELRPVYSMNACGQVYSCAMSVIDKQQGYINGVPYCSISYVPVINGITGKTNDLQRLPSIEGCCAVINLPPVMFKS